MAEPGFWNDRLESQKVSREEGHLRELTEKWENYQADIKHLSEVAELLGGSDSDSSLNKEFKKSKVFLPTIRYSGLAVNE